MVTPEHVYSVAQKIGLEPRDYQSRIISKTVNEFLIHNTKSVLIESPTGSGKTICALLTLKLIQETFPNMRFGWIAMRQKLLKQAAKENERIGVKNIVFVSMFEKNPPEADLIILDEGQHSSCDTGVSLHNLMKAKLSLSMTATPFRTDRIKLAFEKIISDCGVRFLIENKYLSNFDLYTIPKWTPIGVSDIFLQRPKEWGKSIMFFKNTEECEQANIYLRSNGIMSETIFGSMSEHERELIFERYDSGETQILINIYLLTEGFDSPDLISVFCRDTNKLCTMQMAGRSLRKDFNNPNKVAKIVQSEETGYPYSKTAKPRMEYIYHEQTWRSITPGPQADIVSQNVLNKLFTKEVEIPTFLDFGSSNLSVNKKGRIMEAKRRPKKNASNFIPNQEE